MIILVSFLVYNEVTPLTLSLYISFNVLILILRVYTIHQYLKVKPTIMTQLDLDYWLKIYTIGSSLTAFGWGVIYYVFPHLSIEYHFIILAILIGNVSIALLSIGVVTSAYYLYLMLMLGTASSWMIMQDDVIYGAAAVMASFGMIYYAFFTKKYSNSFKQLLVDKEVIKAHNFDLEESQKINIKLRERTELALQGSSTSVLDWDYLNNDSYISPSWKEMLGFSDISATNDFITWKKRVHKSDLRNVLHAIKKAIDREDPYMEMIHRLKHKDGHYLWILGKAQLFYDSKGKLIRMIGTHTDVTKEKEIEIKSEKQNEKLDYQAHHDSLTGLANRTLFNDRLLKGIQKAKRKGSILALLFIDLDHFKEINDSLGHDIGDKVLEKVTAILQQVVRAEDSLSRLGGDEFTVLIEDLKKGEDASVLAKKIITALDKPLKIDNHELHITSSIGVSLFPDDGDSSQDLLKYADSAMYKAKEEGRNSFKFYSAEMTVLALERLVMETSLREAIKNEEFMVFYQPQVNGVTGDIIGMEALVRWNHSVKDMIFPDNFIPLAESTGLIIEIDKYVMKTAMKQLSHWYELGLNPGVLAMNLSVRALEQEGFIDRLKSLLKETACRSEWIELEVTESQIMTRPEEAIKILNQISTLGIKLAVDDFGTGYSSLSYLKKLPIDKLKIDQSFVKGLPEDEEDSAIAKAVIVLAQSLNLRIIAEGVETEEQKNFMIENGCENIQGYLYSKPIPADEFELLLQKKL